jgi:cytochrome c oxidase subunit 2
MGQFTLIPPSAATNAPAVDALYYFQSFVTVVMTAVIFLGIIIFAVKYRKRSDNETPPMIHGSTALEITWSIIPFLVMLVMFFWGAKIYFDNGKAPDNALDVFIVGKQWMWKVQYPGGQREINELHVPVNVPVKLTLASEDVIHSFFLPAFRLKRDVVPGRYNTEWFIATKPGRYHIFCAEYCGTEHSGMVGWVTVMEPKEYENWLAGGGATGTMAEQGGRLFSQLGCSSCHLFTAGGRCPNLMNVFGNKQQLSDGSTVIADEAYIRESILNPNAKIVYGYKPDIMPTFQGEVNEEQLLQLIAYIKSLSPHHSPAAPSAAGKSAPKVPNTPAAGAAASVGSL